MTKRLEGIVSETGRAGARTGGMRTLVLFLRPWRVDGGELQSKELRVEVLMKDEQAARRGMLSHGGKGVAVQVSRLQMPSAKNRWGRGVGAPPVRRIKPEALQPKQTATQGGNAKVAKGPKLVPEVPETIEDQVLGTLALDRSVGGYGGEVKIGRRRFELDFPVDDVEDREQVRRAVRRARTAVARAVADQAKVKEAIADELLDIHNDTWRTGGRRLARGGFVKRLALVSMRVDPERTTLWFSAGGLFGEHGVEVRRTPRGRIEEIGVA